jgi:hypothetical protein
VVKVRGGKKITFTHFLPPGRQQFIQTVNLAVLPRGNSYLSHKPDQSQWRRLQLFLSNGFSKIVFQSGVNKTHKPLDKDRTGLILSFTYPVSRLYPFLSGPLAPSRPPPQSGSHQTGFQPGFSDPL